MKGEGKVKDGGRKVEGKEKEGGREGVGRGKEGRRKGEWRGKEEGRKGEGGVEGGSLRRNQKRLFCVEWKHEFSFLELKVSSVH